MSNSNASSTSLDRLLLVVRRNPEYRRLFAANAISQIGDSLNVVALFSLLLELTGKGGAVSWVLVARQLPMFLVGPLAGVVVDRWSRRAILVISDLLRAALVLCLLLVRSRDQVWLAYAVITLHAVVSTFFEPAQQATFPNLVIEEDLVVASAIENTLWATTLTVGAALGGLLMVALGRDSVFIGDALSFVCSALLLRGLPDRVAKARRAPTRGDEKDVSSSAAAPRESASASASGVSTSWKRLLGVDDFLEGARYISGHPRVLSLILVKSGFGLTLGGVLVLLAFFGEEVFGASHGRGVSALWTARGVGSLLGPFVGWWLGGDSQPALRRGIIVAFATLCVSYLAFSFSPSLLPAAVALAVANAGGSVLWTYGSALLQLLVPDHVRGRVFATDMGVMTMCMTASTLTVGGLLDAGVAPRGLMAGCGLIAVVPIAFWSWAQRHFTTEAEQDSVVGPGEGAG